MLQTLDGYTLMRLICQTASSEVFLAHDHRRREDVVLKVVLPQLVGDKRTLSHFAHEAKVSESLDHPNLVKVYEAAFKCGNSIASERFC